MEQQIIEALKLVIAKYGESLAIQVEQIFRTETTHFKSRGFTITLSPGMEAFTKKQPYGWVVAEQFWKDNKQYAPVGIHNQVENTSALAKSRGVRSFIKFPSIEAAFMTVAFIIYARGGDGGAWFSINDKVFRKKYNDFLETIRPRFVIKIQSIN